MLEETQGAKNKIRRPRINKQRGEECKHESKNLQRM